MTGSSSKIYAVGTLHYALPSLIGLMGWLLLGDFCFNVMESVVPSILPLKLRSLDSPNWLISLLMTAIPSILAGTICPAISYWSDRHRGPRGRRIPFILYTLPFLCVFLVLLGLAPAIADFFSAKGWTANAPALALVLLGVFTVGYQFFNMFVGSVYFYLFNDVVPQEVVGRFMAVFRFVGEIAASFFFMFIFPKGESHFLEIFIGAAVLYGVVFFLMCQRVKEGEYPPPPPRTGTSLRAGARTFLRECYSRQFYWMFYLAMACWAVASTGNVFRVFFAKSAGLNLQDFGTYMSAATIVTAVLILPCGVLSDKFHPVRTMLVSVALQAILAALPLVFLFVAVSPQHSFLVWCLTVGASLPLMALFTASEFPMYMKILPRERYGQFCSALVLVRSVAALLAGLACGLLFDLLTKATPDPDFAYRYLPFWTLLFQGLAAFFLWRVYVEWKQRGGSQNFVAPAIPTT